MLMEIRVVLENFKIIFLFKKSSMMVDLKMSVIGYEYKVLDSYVPICLFSSLDSGA